MDLSCSGIPDEFSVLVNLHLEAAAKALGLVTDFLSIEICADDHSGQDGVWFRFHPGAGDVDPRTGATLYCSCDVFVRPPFSSGGLFPGVEVWEQRPVQSPDPEFDPGEFSAQAADRFLHHNLLLAQDLVLKRVDMLVIPDSLVQAFALAWSVTIDGRLARLDLPGYNLAYRRGRFSGLFSSVGVLLPGHWEIFQSLWDGTLAGSTEVLSACRQLPRL